MSLRILHVGCGGISEAWLASLNGREDTVVAGLVDLNPDAARKRARQFSLEDASIETDLEKALHDLKPDIVFNCTVPEAHESVTLAALAADCHVLSEKPLAHSMDAAHRIVARAREKGRLFAVTQTRRFTEGARRVRSLIGDGVIGQPHSLYADFFKGAHFGGFRDCMEHVLLLDMAIHHFDLARMLAAGRPAKRVVCHEFNPAGSWYRHGACANALFEMTGDVRFNYRGSWCAEGHGTSWNAAWRIVGECGTLIWDGESQVTVERPAGDTGFIRPVETLDYSIGAPQSKKEGHAAVIDEFLNAVRTGGPLETSGEDNIHSLGMVFAAIESAEQGKPVEFPLPTGSELVKDLQPR